MKFLNFLVAFFVFVTQSVAQQNHFIYIQTENKQPFYVRLGDRILSSSSVGYIVIPKLQNGSYELNIGFPKNEWPQQKITVPVNNNDAGFVLKNFEEKGWGLFNMQSLDILMAAANPVKDAGTGKQDDGFADVLADVVNTPSIKQKPPVKETTEAKAPVENKATTPVQNNKPTVAVKEEKPAVAEMIPAVKIFSNLDESGRSAVYVDRYDNKQDTVRIYIPYDKIEKETKEVVAVVPEKPKEAEPKPLPKETKEPAKEDKKFLDIEIQNPNTKTDAVVKEPVQQQKEQTVEIKEPVTASPPKAETVMINSDCKSIATEDDFLKLRKKMAAQRTDDNMIVVAKKSFVSKCYTTEQINNLSALFLKDEGRYNFFDAAYPHVNDSKNFGSLISRLSDEYYINRFKAMMRH